MDNIEIICHSCNHKEICRYVDDAVELSMVINTDLKQEEGSPLWVDINCRHFQFFEVGVR